MVSNNKTTRSPPILILRPIKIYLKKIPSRGGTQATTLLANWAPSIEEQPNFLGSRQVLLDKHHCHSLTKLLTRKLIFLALKASYEKITLLSVNHTNHQTTANRLV